MKLYESSEDYLERILILNERNGKCRSIDIAEDMGFSKASVSIAMKKLKENGYITIESNGVLILTDKGNEVATKTYERHNVIASLLISIGVSKEQAYKDACKMEHDISDETYYKLKEHQSLHSK